MGFFNTLKTKFAANGKNQEELDSYLKNAKIGLKSAYTNLNQFIEGVKSFQPARRHQDFYQTEIVEKLLLIKENLVRGSIFLDRKLKNDIDGIKNSTIRSTDQLKKFLDSWALLIREENPETDNGIIKKLRTEMWSEERKARGFPVSSKTQQ